MDSAWVRLVSFRKVTTALLSKLSVKSLSTVVWNKNYSVFIDDILWTVGWIFYFIYLFIFFCLRLTRWIAVIGSFKSVRYLKISPSWKITEIPWGRDLKQSALRGVYGYFLELHIVNRVVTLTILTKWTLGSRETARLNLFLLYWTYSLVYRCGILHVSAVSRQKFGTAKWCLVKQIFCRMKVAIRWVVFYCSCLFGGRSSFTLFFAKHEKFSDIFPISRRLENNWAKATSSSGLFICRSNFLAITVDVILPYIANVIGELGIWANGNRVEYSERILSGVMFRSGRTCV